MDWQGATGSVTINQLVLGTITLATRLVDTVTTPMLLKTLVAGKLDPRPLVTHRFRMGEMEKAYETFASAAREKALKVVLVNE